MGCLLCRPETIILEEEKSRVFFYVRKYKSWDKPPVFDVRTLCPGETEAQVAERLPKYFNSISGVSALKKPNQIPTTYAKKLPLLEPFQYAV